jgi:hypothetical protein
VPEEAASREPDPKLLATIQSLREKVTTQGVELASVRAELKSALVVVTEMRVVIGEAQETILKQQDEILVAHRGREEQGKVIQEHEAALGEALRDFRSTIFSQAMIKSLQVTQRNGMKVPEKAALAKVCFENLSAQVVVVRNILETISAVPGLDEVNLTLRRFVARATSSDAREECQRASESFITAISGLQGLRVSATSPGT